MSTPETQTPSPDPLARGLTAAELAEIEAAKGKPAPVQAQPLRWGPLKGAELIALGYVQEADAASLARLNEAEAREIAAQQKRHHDLIEAVVGRRPPLVEGHALRWTQDPDGKTYLVAVPVERQS